MSSRRAQKVSEVPISFVARIVEDPHFRVVDGSEVLVLQLAVPVWAEDFERGTFPVEAVTPAALGRNLLQALGIGCRLWVTGNLDVGESLTPGWEHRLGLRVRVDEISLEEIDRVGAEPPKA